MMILLIRDKKVRSIVKGNGYATKKMERREVDV